MGIGLADETDAEGVDEALKRDTAARLDRAAQIVRLLAAPTGQLGELLQPLAQTKYVGRLRDQAGLEQLRHLLAAQTLDVERVAADKMTQPFRDLGGANQPTHAA